MTDRVVAIIADIVGSRELADRGSAQLAIEESLRRASADAELVEPFRPTTGDEFQAVARSLHDAVRVTTAALLDFPRGAECRFGLGEGESTLVRSSEGDALRDGSAWWRAREAIEAAHREEDAGRDAVRSWFVSDAPDAGPVTAALLLRDHVVGRMKSRERALTLGRLRGATQVELAREHGVSQSAVSQNLDRSGGALLVRSLELWKGRERDATTPSEQESA